MTHSPPFDSTGLERHHIPADGSVLSPSLRGTQISVVPTWVQKLSRAPGTLATASLAHDLLTTLQYDDDVRNTVHQFVRDFGESIIKQWGQCLLIRGGKESLDRRILGAGILNEILRVYHYRADITAHWLAPRVFETLSSSYDRDKMTSLFGTYAHSKLVVVENLNASMRNHRGVTEELLMARIQNGVPTVLLMQDSPVFSADLASELSSSRHLRCSLTP